MNAVSRHGSGIRAKNITFTSYKTPGVSIATPSTSAQTLNSSTSFDFSSSNRSSFSYAPMSQQNQMQLPLLPSLSSLPQSYGMDKSVFAKPLPSRPTTQSTPMSDFSYDVGARSALKSEPELIVKLRLEPHYGNNFGDVTITLPLRSSTTDLMRHLRELCNLGVTALVLVAYVNDRTILLELDQPLAQCVTPGKPLIVSLFMGVAFATVSIPLPPSETSMSTSMSHLPSLPPMVPMSQMGVVPPIFSPIL
jgi:hypothetical protein